MLRENAKYLADAGQLELPQIAGDNMNNMASLEAVISFLKK